MNYTVITDRAPTVSPKGGGEAAGEGSNYEL
jgi:hypothetical protein